MYHNLAVQNVNGGLMSFCTHFSFWIWTSGHRNSVWRDEWGKAESPVAHGFIKMKWPCGSENRDPEAYQK